MATTLLWGAPSNGKSYIATLWAILEMIAGRRVFSSYPIVYTMPLSLIQRLKNLIIYLYNLVSWILLFKVHHNIKWYYPIDYIKNKVYSSYKWEHSYIDTGINDSSIYIDEGYKYFNCHDKLTSNEHDFFALSGHNNNDVYVIAQNYMRINVAIRELANYFVYVTKFSNPFSMRNKTGRKQLTPLFFNTEMYISEADFKMRTINPKVIYEKKRIWFNSNIAEAYNTQYFRTLEQELKPVLWINELKEKKKKREEKVLAFKPAPEPDILQLFEQVTA
jgi:hypothetical protein